MIDQPQILWRLHVDRPRADVWQLLSTDAGRERFWAERSRETTAGIELTFPDGTTLLAPVLASVEGELLALEYFAGARVELRLSDADGGGTIVELRESAADPATVALDAPGWVSVLLNLKAVAQHGIDLRNHHPHRHWGEGFVDN